MPESTVDTEGAASAENIDGATTGTFDALAGTRPRVRRDVLFTETPGGVLFHNADGGFHLTGRTAYRFASLVVPHLTGRHRLAEICAGFAAAQRAMAAELVKTLYERGFARDIPEAEDERAAAVSKDVEERFAAQIAYIDHYVDAAVERFGRFRSTRVAVLGTDEVARWCALSLVRNGCARIGTAVEFADVVAEAAQSGAGAKSGAATEPARVEVIEAGAEADWNDLRAYDVVVVTGGGAGARTHRLLAAGVPQGLTLIPSWTFGAHAVTGPLSTATSTGCWSCAVLRLGGNVDPGAAADLWSEAATATPPVQGNLSGPVAAMVGNLLGYEIFRLTTGALPPETDRQVLVQDLASLDVRSEPVQPHPRCLRCGALDSSEPAPALPGGLALPVTPTVGTAREAEELVEDLNRISTALVRPYTGIFRRYDDEELTQTPLKISRVEVALGRGERRRIAAFDVHHLAGARMRALCAAAQAYVEHVVPVDAESGTGATIGPEALATGGGTGGVVSAWVTATSLLSKEPVRVPAAAVRTFGPANRDRLHLATSAGSGAGGSAQEAAGRGLLSALAHDALLRAVRGATMVSPVAADGGARDGDGSGPELVFLLKSAVNLDLSVELLDLAEGARTSAQVVLAREAGGRWAAGAGLSRRAAACEALRDLIGQVQLAAEDPETVVDLGDPLVGDLAAGTIAVTGDAVAADAAATTFEAILDRLRESGRDALYVPTTPADLPAGGVSTARVLLTTDGPHAS
ncbi:TOMM precursor leader peptide-binding protein [Streptomyces sp. NPDC058545]|uniref:TOMM precursor leader peptide-binding protein n=1 Tax=Streptomyces sp. NPDC058545 TaxID=3346544 RepID=UPI00364D51F6